MTQTATATAAAHPAFEHLRTEHIDSLNIDVSEYRHKVTGARHFHMAADDNNNAFLVAFLTVPQDSTGVAHILEHTSLCGSERFPVRDPFFMMTRRSLNTFMNAFTASDWTAYPFASQNVKDFDNLMDVYLDATFFPRLDPLDFAQEGHRVEFEDPQNPDSDLVFKGVVFNEMKGAMSSPVSNLWHTLQSHVFPTVTYHHNSGGEPENIPDLSYDELKAFHARHYHPSNATFMTYGNLPAEHHQVLFEDKALSKFDKLDMDLSVPDEQRYTAPIEVAGSYATDDTDTANKAFIVLAWLLGHSADLDAVMEAHMLSSVLLDNSASPLRHVLETSDLGTAPAPISGLDDSTREASFICGLEGCDPAKADAVQALILNALKKVAEEGVAQEEVESVLHQLELSQREVGGGHFPYGLQLMVNALSPALHGGDPVAVLNIDPVLAKLREDIKDPQYIPKLINKLLLNNPHRVRLTFGPDTELAGCKEQAEKARLAEIRAKLVDQEKQQIVKLAAELEQRQMRQDDPEVLPKVTLEDVPADMKIALGQVEQVADMNATWYSQGTNGLVYAQLVVDLPELKEELTDLLPIYTDVLTEVGVGDKDYLETQRWQAAVSGGISARASVRGAVDDPWEVKGVFILKGKALASNIDDLAEILKTTFTQPRFDELSRLRELVAQDRAHREAHITDRGHSLAMVAASAALAPTAALSHRWNGLQGIVSLKALDDGLNEEQGLKDLADKLGQIHQILMQAPRRLLLVGEEANRKALCSAFDAGWQDLPSSAEMAPFTVSATGKPARDGWATSSQVSFSSKAYTTVPVAHPDAPALTVLGGFLRNGFLHRAIREQGGAYGAGASYDSDSGSFRFYSYRDPRLVETLADFDASVDWLLNTDHDPSTLEEAILGVVSSIDRPESPAGEAVSAYYAALHGRTPEWRRAYRASVLKVSLDDLKRVAKAYLDPAKASVAVLSDQKTLEAANAAHAELGLTIHQV